MRRSCLGSEEKSVVTIDITTWVCYFDVVTMMVTMEFDMNISSRFAIAVHSLVLIRRFSQEYKVTSEFIASSVNVNPVVIRRILLQLSGEGIISVKRGAGGAVLARRDEDVTLLDVYNAVDAVDGDLFSFHENPNPDCPVGRNIHAILDERLRSVQSAMERELAAVTLADLEGDLDIILKEEKR